MIIDSSALRAGDLLFLKSKAKPRLIDHVAVVLSTDKIFHCKRGMGMVLDSLKSLFEAHEQTIKIKQLTYIDTRNWAAF